MHFKYYKAHRLTLFLVGLTVLVGTFVRFCIHPLIEHTVEPFQTIIIYTEMFTVPFFIGIIFWLIDNYGWKSKWWKWLVDLPDMNGRYIGQLESTYQTNGKNTIIECAVEVKQTASNITISAYFYNPTKNEYSKSDSVIELIEKQKNGSFLLYYIYTNTPGILHAALNMHEGTTVCIYYPDNRTLVGQYYNSRPLTGMFSVERKSDKLIHRFQ